MLQSLKLGVAGLVLAFSIGICGRGFEASISARSIDSDASNTTVANESGDQNSNDADVKFFRDEVEPIFKESCQRCHGEKKQESSLRLDSREALLKGGKNGATIVPGKPDDSLLLKVLDYTGDIQMPPDAKLDDEKREAIKKWIEKDAPWPKAKS